jgi:1-acyl-sn-glycerol-3-phosphate acyltransferase
MRAPQAPHPGPRVGPLRRLVGRAWLRAFGWSLADEVPVAEKAVFVAAPHTSNWDLPFTLAVAWALDMDIRWAGKTSLFKPPFGRVMRALGGMPIERSKRVHWKSGFYRIAQAADVPMMMGFLDYEKKRGGLAFTMRPTGDVAKDMETIRAFYANVRGRFPHKESTPRLKEEEDAGER